MTSAPAVVFNDVCKTYHTFGSGARHALQNVSFVVPAGERVAIVGRSGSGKSTLLHLAAGIDVPTSGRVTLRGRDLAGLSERDRTLLRRDEVGLVFQFFHLVPYLSVRDNVALPAMIAGNRSSASRVRVDALLQHVGLDERADDQVQQLSGGEMQRVALCRALLRQPRLLLADEPTGNLDDENGDIVMQLMLSLTEAVGSTLVFVTHSVELAALADRVWELHSGRLSTA